MPATTRDLEHPDPADLVLTDVLFALSDPVRLQIVRQLAEGPLVAMSCQAVLPDMAKSTRSHHLKTLREAGVVSNVPHGRERMVSLRRDALDARFPGLLDSVLAAAPAE
ncbi:ArsR/SmtB family transcription factor [Motilibacter deserti]|uniref:Transcriptional regulator n=1 Tax=Motilibacter deserti TaxID=2714956 RepID=A0ABX0GZD2_9ACTN|nr:metalloregulator ArsR/SmtB family transcription factor [Motilibacter deserti]NHC15075.1 transcriptional regulator [Motilibacter deserti]